MKIPKKRLEQAVTRFKHGFADRPTRALDELLSTDTVCAIVDEEVGAYRDRIYPPLTTLGLFIGQALSGGSTNRSQGKDRARTEGLYHGEHVFQIAERVIEIAQTYEKRPAQIALAWLLNKPEITAPVVGVSKIEQLDQLVDATSIELAAEDVTYLEELYQPVDNLLSIGFS